MGALSDPQVGEFLSQHFVAGYEQIGGFRAVNVNGRVQKNGGNVASYFCTPEGRVIHAVAGPVRAETLLAEARWALDAYRSAEAAPWERAEALRTAHRTAADGRARNNNQQRQIHQILARRPLPLVADVQREVFERVLNERVRDDSSLLSLAVHAYETAQENNQPVLLILHRDSDSSRVRDRWRSLLYDAQQDLRSRDRDAAQKRQSAQTLLALARQYVVVGLHINELPALSERLGIEPYTASSSGSPLLIFTRDDGRQVAEHSGWPSRERLSRALVRGLIEQARETSATPTQLRQLLLVARGIDDAVALEVRQLLQKATASRTAAPQQSS